MSNNISITGIISYPNLFTAVPHKNKPKGEKKFGCNILILKNDPQMKLIDAEIETAISGRWPDGMPPDYEVYCKKTFPDDESYWTISAKSKENQRPDLADSNLQDIVDPSVVQAGKMGRMSLGIYAYDEGITAGLNGVQVLDELGALGALGLGKPSRESMFGDESKKKSVSSYIITAKGLEYWDDVTAAVEYAGSIEEAVTDGFIESSVEQYK